MYQQNIVYNAQETSFPMQNSLRPRALERALALSMHEAGQKRNTVGQKRRKNRRKNKRNLQKFSNWLPHPFPCKCRESPSTSPSGANKTHLIGDPRVFVVIRLFGCYGQHGAVGLLCPLIIQIRIILIVPRLRRQIGNPTN